MMVLFETIEANATSAARLLIADQVAAHRFAANRQISSKITLSSKCIDIGCDYSSAHSPLDRTMSLLWLVGRSGHCYIEAIVIATYFRKDERDSVSILINEIDVPRI